MKPEPKNKKQLAREMGVSLRTLQRLLQKAEISIPRGLIAPERQKEILEKLGWHELT